MAYRPNRPKGRKQCVYFRGNMFREVHKEATRLERSASWVLEQAWRLAKDEIKTYPRKGQDGAPE